MRPSSPVSLFERYVGIPFVAKGRTLEGCDCWGLVRLVLERECGVVLPSYCDQYLGQEDRVALAELIAGELGPWCEIAAGSETTFDGVLMHEHGLPRHIGIVVDPGRVLHVERHKTSVIERYRTGFMRHRILGFYRYNP